LILVCTIESLIEIFSELNSVVSIDADRTHYKEEARKGRKGKERIEEG